MKKRLKRWFTKTELGGITAFLLMGVPASVGFFLISPLICMVVGFSVAADVLDRWEKEVDDAG